MVSGLEPVSSMGVRADQGTTPRVWVSQVSQPVRGWGWDEACAAGRSFPGTSPGGLKEVGFTRLFSDVFGVEPTGAALRYHEENEKLLRGAKLFSFRIWGQHVVTGQLIGVW